MARPLREVLRRFVAAAALLLVTGLGFRMDMGSPAVAVPDLAKLAAEASNIGAGWRHDAPGATSLVHLESAVRPGERHGFVCHYNSGGGFGFITPDGAPAAILSDVFFHFTSIDADLPDPPPLGLKVVFAGGAPTNTGFGNATSVRSERVRGKVLTYDARGFGFVRAGDGADSHYFERKDVRNGDVEGLKRNSRVSFLLGRNTKRPDKADVALDIVADVAQHGGHTADRAAAGGERFSSSVKFMRAHGGVIRRPEGLGTLGGSRVSRWDLFFTRAEMEGFAVGEMLSPGDRVTFAVRKSEQKPGTWFAYDIRREAAEGGLPPRGLQAAEVAARPDPLRVAAIVVDGYSFALHTRRHAPAAAELIAFVRRALAAQAGVPEASVVVPAGAMAFVHPDEHDARRKGIITPEESMRTNDFLSMLEQSGWQIKRSGFKREGGQWKASIEDLVFSNICNEFAQPGAFPLVGARSERVTATDLFIVTRDADHTFTLESGDEGSALRWCVLLAPNPPLERWGEGTQRLLRYSRKQPRAGAAERRSTGSGHTSGCRGPGDCSDPECPEEHRMLAVDGFSAPVGANKLPPTRGKSLALSGKLGTQLWPCRHFQQPAGCSRRENCRFAHIRVPETTGEDAPSSPNEGLPAGTEPTADSAGSGSADRDSAENHDAAERLCCVCFDSVEAGEYVPCSEGHACCDGCFSDFVELTWAERDFDDVETPVVACLVDGCACEFSNSQVMKRVSDAAGERYMTILQQAKSREAVRNMQTLIDAAVQRQEEHASETRAQRRARRVAERRLLAEQLRRELPHAMQCPECGFGPIDYRGCDSVRTHQGERVSGGGVVDNRCRGCGFLADTRDEYVPWNGELPEAASSDDEGGAVASSSTLPPVPVVTEEQLTLWRLTDLGFSEEDAERALSLVGGDGARAATLLYECDDQGVSVRNSVAARRMLEILLE